MQEGQEGDNNVDRGEAWVRPHPWRPKDTHPPRPPWGGMRKPHHHAAFGEKRWRLRLRGPEVGRGTGLSRSRASRCAPSRILAQRPHTSHHPAAWVCRGAGLQGRPQVRMPGCTAGSTCSKETPPPSLRALPGSGGKDTHQRGREPQPGQGPLFHTGGRQNPLLAKLGLPSPSRMHALHSHP